MEYQISTGWAIVLFILAVWDTIWRGMAMWRAGRNGEQGWFVALLLVNSVGLLPIIYLLTHKEHTTK